LFPVDESQSTADYWKVRYDKTNSCAIGVRSLSENQECLGRIYVDRPCGHMRLWDALFSILQMGSVALFFPGGPFIVGDERTAAELPQDIRDANNVVFVRSGEALVKLVQES
jgi:hypothetical protein